MGGLVSLVLIIIPAIYIPLNVIIPGLIVLIVINLKKVVYSLYKAAGLVVVLILSARSKASEKGTAY